MVWVCVVVCSFGGGVSWCPLVQRSAGFRCFKTCRRLALVLWWCVPCLLPAFLLCLWCFASEYGFISRFKGGFTGFLLFRVGLLGLGAFRGLWGFCTREVFGGLEACGVFASISSLLSSFFFFFAFLLSSFLSFCSCVCLSFCPLCSCFYLFSCLPCLSSCPLLVLLPALFVLVSLWGLCFPFPFRTIRKKKGRNSLRPLLSCCGLLYLVADLYASYSSGVSPFIS